MAVGDRFVRNHTAARTSTSNTTAANLTYNNTLINDDVASYTYTGPHFTVTDAGRYLFVFDIGQVDLASTRAVGTLVPRIGSVQTDLPRFRATHRYLRNSGGAQEGASIGMCILDLPASEQVRVRMPGTLSPTDAINNYATNVNYGGAMQCIRLPDTDWTHVERTSDAAEVGTSNINTTRPWLVGSGTWTKITYNSEVNDDGALYPGTGGDLTLAANTKYLVVWGVTCYSTDASRHTYVAGLNIDGNRVQTGSGYQRNTASQGPPMCGMYLHETGGTSETLYLEATHETEGGDAGTPNVSDAYLQVIELPSSAEWIHVDNGATDSLTTALTSLTTWYDTPLSSTFRADGDSNLSLDSANNAVQNDSGGSLPVLAIGWHRWDRDSGSSGTRKNPWTRWDNGGTNLGYGVAGAYSRGQQSSDDTFQAHYCSVVTTDLANGADLSFQVNDEASATQGDMGIYASTSRYFLGVQVLNLETLTAAGGTDVDAEPTGAEISGDAGTSSSTAGASQTLTGAEISADAGASTSTAGASQNLTGAEAAGEPGAVDAQTSTGETAPVTGAEAAGEAGATTQTGDANHTLAGAEAAGEAGTVQAEAGVTTNISGSEAAAEAGVAQGQGDAEITLAGAEASGEAGASSAIAERNVTDLSQFASHGLPVNTYGSFAGKAGSAVDADGEPPGAAIAGQAGTTASRVDTSEAPSGAEIAGEAGTSTVTVDHSQDVTGAEIAAEAGTSTSQVSTDGTPSGAEITGEAGTSSVRVDTSETPAGGEILGEAGTVVAGAVTVATVTGAAAAGEAGTVTVRVDHVEAVTGAEITGEAGTVTAGTVTAANITGAASAGEAGTTASQVDASATLAGAEVAGAAGTVTATGAIVGLQLHLGPHGLVTRYPPPTRSPAVNIIGSAISAEAGNVDPGVASSIRQQLSPHGLPIRARAFAPPDPDTFAYPAGAQIVLQWGTPDSANATIYPDGVDSGGQAGLVFNPQGAESACQAGAVTVEVLNQQDIVGDEISGEAGTVTAGEGLVSVTGASISGEAGATSQAFDWSEFAVGSLINGQASEPGVDESRNVNVTIAPATIQAQHGPVLGVDEIAGAGVAGLGGNLIVLPEWNTAIDGWIVYVLAESETVGILESDDLDTLACEAENETVTVTAEGETVTVESEDDTLLVLAENETVTVEVDTEEI